MGREKTQADRIHALVRAAHVALTLIAMISVWSGYSRGVFNVPGSLALAALVCLFGVRPIVRWFR